MNYYLLLVFVVVFLVIIIRYHLNRLSFYKCSYSLPGPRAWPIIGNALWCAGNSEDILKSILTLTKKYSSPYRFWLGSKLVVVITKPRDLEVVLNSCIHKENTMRFLRPFLGNGLITVQSSEWKQRRKLINPTFNQKILNSFIPTFVEHSNILIQRLSNQTGKNEFDIYKYISLNSLDFICDTTMGIKMNAQIQSSEYAETLHRYLEKHLNNINQNVLRSMYERVLGAVFARMSQVWNHFDTIFYRTPTGIQFSKDLKVIHKYAKEVLKKKTEQFEYESNNKILIQHIEDTNEDTNCSKRKAFLEHLLELKGNGNNFDESHIFDEINTFIGAGTDTTSSVISFVCMMLGSHKQIQEKVYEEILDVLYDITDDSISNSDLQKLQYLERVIKETMRLFPVTPLLIRSTTHPIELESCTLPAEVEVLYMIMHTHRDPELWIDPLQFNPDRFLPENIAQRHAYSYLPFGAGLRYCIGLRYAMMAMKMVLVMLIRNYKFHSKCNIETLRLESRIVLKPVFGHLVQIESRNI